MRVVTPDQAMRQTVLAMPAFHGANGQFDKATFDAVLRNNGLTEPRFLDMMRSDLSQRQVLGAVGRRGNHAGRCCCARCSRASSRSARPTWWNSRSAPRPSRRRPTRPSSSAGTTTIRTCIPPRNSAGSRRSCCRRRRWRRTSRSPTPTCRPPTISTSRCSSSRRSAPPRWSRCRTRPRPRRLPRNGAAGRTGPRCRRRRRMPAARRLRWTTPPSSEFPDAGPGPWRVRRRTGRHVRPGEGGAWLACRARQQGHPGQRRRASTT